MTTDRPLWSIVKGDGPIVATAIHHGHDTRPEVAGLFALTENARLREEDPYSGGWTEIAETRIVVNVSRFEMDLNRPRGKAIYREPEDAWGLEVWKQPLPASVEAASVERYDAFYRTIYALLSEIENRCGAFVVLDLHTYNHRRDGPDRPPAPAEGHPDINVGTGNMDRTRWARIVDRFIRDLRKFDFLGRRLDTRENVKFQGGHFSRWIHDNFPDSACCLAVEVKKFFMDEWTGELDAARFDAVREALRSTLPGLREELARRGAGG